MRAQVLLLMFALVVTLGCGDSSSPPASGGGGGFGSYSSTPTAPATTETTTPVNDADRFKTPLPDFPVPDINEPPSQVAVDDCMEGSRLRESQYAMSRGVGKIKDTELKALLEWQIPHALDLYQAEKGEYPADWDAFVRDIIEFNQLKLPTLRPGYEYWFDSENGVLMKRPTAEAIAKAEQEKAAQDAAATP